MNSLHNYFSKGHWYFQVPLTTVQLPDFHPPLFCQLKALKVAWNLPLLSRKVATMASKIAPFGNVRVKRKVLQT